MASESRDVDIRHLPLELLADLCQEVEDRPAKRVKLDDAAASDTPRLLLRTLSYRIKPVGRALGPGSKEIKQHVATLENSAPLSFEVKLDLITKPVRKGSKARLVINVRKGGRDLLEVDDMDPLVFAALNCRGVETTSELHLRRGEAPNGSPSSFIDFQIDIVTEISLGSEFAEVSWPQSGVASRLHFLELAFPVAEEDEAIAERYSEVVLPEDHDNPTVELFYASLPPPPRPPVDRKGKKADKPSSTLPSFTLNPAGLLPTLMPFQERSVRWMLSREGKGVDEKQQALVDVEPGDEDAPFFWQAVRGTAEAEGWHINRVTGELSFGPPKQKAEAPDSGLLSEEMGLGKTIEILALIMLHQDQARNASPASWDDTLEANVKPSSLTLIIVPSAIVNQWEKEINKHAPSLRIFRYQSVKKLSDKMTAKVVSRDYDIVLTTFDVLRAEVNVARAPVHRASRSATEGRPKYSWRRSLLVELDFLRVVMDEPQMGANAGSIAETCSLIRRRYSWAVSGTPLKKSVSDLSGILKFLRIEPVGSNAHAFARLVNTQSIFPLVDLLQRISIRTAKAAVVDELHIPQQKRVLVPLDFGPVEAYAFQQRYEEAIADLGFQLGAEGMPADWELDAGKMRSWLGKLRQLCCNQAVGVQKDGQVKLRSLEDVLHSMRDGNAMSLELDERAHAAAIIRRGHLTLYDHETCANIEAGIAHFDRACGRLRPLKQRLEGEIETLQKQLKMRKSQSPMDLDDNEEEEQEERELTRRIGTIANRLREVIEALHSAVFFRASAWFQLGKFPQQENRDYEEAEALRKQVLSNGSGDAARKMQRLKDRLTEGEQLDITDLEVAFTKSRPGIQTKTVFENIEETTNVLNGIAEVLWEWREELVARVLEDIEQDTEDDPNGEEYLSHAEKQEEVDIRLELYQRLLYDWHQRLTGERSAMAGQVGHAAVAQEATQINDEVALIMHGKRKKKGNQFDRRALLELLEEDTPAQKLRKRMLIMRDDLIGGDVEEGVEDVRPSLRRSMANLNTVKRDAERIEEVAIADAEARRLKQELIDREKAFDALSKELQPIRDAFNARIAYYAILQEFSDSVEVIDVKARDFQGVQQELQKAKDAETRTLLAIRAKEQKSRYLDNLTDKDHLPALAQSCIICQESTADKAVLTDCAHVFCESCFTDWHRRSKTCPLCTRKLTSSEYKKVSLSAIKAEPGQEGSSSTIASKEAGLDSSIFNLLPVDAREEIAAMPIRGNVGTKLDFLAKHVRFLRRDDPDAKVVVFTAWKVALAVLREAFTRNGVRFVELNGSQKLKQQAVRTFSEDPEVVAFLLHAESSAAGLNLIAASTIILVEPLLHSSTELQAVGRVHRIGQLKETTVYQYCVSNTPDERIAQLAARKGTSLFTKRKRMTSPDADAPINPDGVGETALEDTDDLTFAFLASGQRLQLQHHILAQAQNADAMEED